MRAKEFYTKEWHFTIASAKGNQKAGEIQGQIRQHSRLIQLPGVKQIGIHANEMDCDMAGYQQARYDGIANDMNRALVEVANEMESTLGSADRKKEVVERGTLEDLY